MPDLGVLKWPALLKRARSAWAAPAVTSLVLLTGLWMGCGSSEIRGTYDVEIEILGASGPLRGTLILSTSMLDVPALSEADKALGPEWFGADRSEANSCFIIYGGESEEAGPLGVRLFESWLQGRELMLPVELYRTPRQRIELVKVQFFANAIGGDVVLHEDAGSRPGRLHGTRVGEPDTWRCLDEFDAFRAILRSALAE